MVYTEVTKKHNNIVLLKTKFNVRNKKLSLPKLSCVLLWLGMNVSVQLGMSYLCLEGDISHSVGPRPCPHYNSRAAW